MRKQFLIHSMTQEKIPPFKTHNVNTTTVHRQNHIWTEVSEKYFPYWYLFSLRTCLKAAVLEI